jgi:TIR domain/Sel1 repeat
MAHDVFISHSVKDKTTADAVCAMLESSGVRCWIAPRDVVPGREWGEWIVEAIKECRIMVLVFTSHANESPQIRREVERAVNHGVMILPLRIEDVIPATALEYFIGNVHWLDALTPPLETHLKSLARTVKILLARTTSPVPPPPPPPIHPVPEPLHRKAETQKWKPANAVERKERALDAAMSRTVPVGRATQVLVMVREADSQGLRRVLKIEEDYSVTPEDVRSREIEIEFPVDSLGNQQPAEFNLRLEAPDFEPRSQAKRLLVPVDGDSEICSFLVTAQRAGELLLNLEVLTRESSIVTRTFKTTAHANAPAEISAPESVLVSVPLYTSASTWSAHVFVASTSSSGSGRASDTFAPNPPMATSPPPAKSSTRKLVGLGAIFAVALLAVGTFTYQKWGAGDAGSQVAEAPPAAPAETVPTTVTTGAGTPQTAGLEQGQSGQTSTVPPDVPSSPPKAAKDLYDRGNILEAEERLPEAVNSYQAACDGGYALSCNYLGAMYMDGKQLPQDDHRAVQLFQKACDSNYAWGCVNLGEEYEKGRGLPQDIKRAARLYQHGCDLGNADGCAGVKRILIIK